MYKEMFTQLWVACEYYHTIGEREKVANHGKAGGNGVGGGGSEGGTEDEEEAGSEDRRVMDGKLRSK